MSEFVLLFRSTSEAQERALGSPEQAQKGMQTWLAWLRELEADGQLKHPGQPLDRRGKVVRGADRLVRDGPYVEAKEYQALESFWPDVLDRVDAAPVGLRSACSVNG